MNLIITENLEVINLDWKKLVCFKHPEKEAAAKCRNEDLLLCAECRDEILKTYGNFMCPKCKCTKMIRIERWN